LKEYFEKSILPQFNKLDIENFASMLVVARRISTEVRI
jgi:CRISPR-associated protein Cmr2